MKILGLDLGDRHVGVAVLDTTVPVALPLPDFTYHRFFIRALTKLVAEQQTDEIVIGLPLTLAGTDSPQTKKVRALANQISTELNRPVHLQDERFTTRQASGLLKSMGPSPAHHLDSVAAQLILEAWWATRSA